MIFLYGVLMTACLAYFLIQIFYLFQLLSIRKQKFTTSDNYPFISILVAARNEEENILHCMKSLSELEYPVDRIEIIIGNDLSTDSTSSIIRHYIHDKPQFRCIDLTGEEYPQTKGKARVLAELAAHSTGEILLITDADITVNPKWAKGMVDALIETRSGLVAGVTNIRAHNFFTQFQQVDWLYFMGLFFVASHIKKPISAVGNNMAVLKKAYTETGGYEAIPFSITEDYALFRAVREKGYSTLQLMNNETLLYSKPIDTLKGLLRQRKRWLIGGNDLPVHFRAMIFIFGLWYIALPILFLSGYWLWVLILLVLKDFIQLFQIILINRKLNLKIENPLAVFLYDLYLFIVIPLTAIYYFIPGKTVWKGRKY